MKLRYIALSIAALLTVVAVSAAACGGDDDGDDGDGGSSTSDIRTEKGLTAANIDIFGGGGAEEGDDAIDRDGESIGGAPAPAADLGGFADGPAVAERGFGGDLAPFGLQAQAGTANGITVAGYGTATADADSARIEFYFGKYSNGPIPLPESPPDGSSSSGDEPSEEGVRSAELQEVTPITEEDLQPVIDALVAAGVDRNDIEFIGQGYYDRYWASATLRATVGNLDAIDAIVEAGNQAATALQGIETQGSSVMYTVGDCSALESAALQTAIEDAGDNAQAFAAALGVSAGEIIGAANYSYFAEDDGSCGGYWGYPVYDTAFAAGPAEVSVYAQVAITYAIQ